MPKYLALYYKCDSVDLKKQWGHQLGHTAENEWWIFDYEETFSYFRHTFDRKVQHD